MGINDIRVNVMDFGNSVPSMAVSCEDGECVIFLNSRMCHECLQQAYYHELRHIIGMDFEKDNADIIEFKAH